MHLLASVFALLLLIPAPADSIDDDLLAWSKDLMQRALVMDAHCDTLMGVTGGHFDLSKRNAEGHMDIPRLLEAGVDGQFFACWINPRNDKGREVQRTLDMIDALYQTAAKDERLVIATTASQVLAAQKAGKIAGILAIEGGTAINDDLAMIRIFHALGVRYMTLTWMDSNNWADSSGPDQSAYGNLPSRGGLTEFGEQVVREMNRLGMIIDLSHVHDDTFWDVMAIATKPVIVSHSCIWGINPHFRNVKDEMLTALAKNGGVIGINFAPDFLSAEYAKASEAVREQAMAEFNTVREQFKDDPDRQRAEWRRIRGEFRGKVQKVPMSVLCDHIEYAARVAGYDHVGLGSDFDGIGDTPEGLDDCTGLVNIVVELRRRGWSEENLRKFLGENFLRVLRANAGE